MKIFYLTILLIFAFLTTTSNIAGQNVFLSNSGKRWIYYTKSQNLGITSVFKNEVTPLPKGSAKSFILRFFGSNIDFVKEKDKVKQLSKTIQQEGLIIEPYYQNALLLEAKNNPQVYQCLITIGACNENVLANFEKNFSTLFNLNLREVSSEYNTFKGIWELETYGYSPIGKTNQGKLFIDPNSKNGNSVVSSNYQSLPLISFELTSEFGNPMLAIHTYFPSFGKTIMVSQNSPIVYCYFYDDNFKAIKGGNFHNQQIAKLIENNFSNFQDLPDNMKIYLTPQLFDFWKTCK